MVGAGVRLCGPEDLCANHGARGHEAVVGLCMLSCEGRRPCLGEGRVRGEGEGREGLKHPHGQLQGALEEGVVGICQRPGQVYCCHLIQGLFQVQGKQQRPKRLALTHPALRAHHFLW
jgi:hypothetical protein